MRTNKEMVVMYMQDMTIKRVKISKALRLKSCRLI